MKEKSKFVGWLGPEYKDWPIFCYEDKFVNDPELFQLAKESCINLTKSIFYQGEFPVGRLTREIIEDSLRQAAVATSTDIDN